MALIKPNTEGMQKGRSAAGAPTFNSGDIVAEALQGQPLEVAYKVAAELGLEVRGKYDHLNPGHQRMVLGTRMRKVVKDQEKARATDGPDSQIQSGEEKFLAAVAKHRIDPEVESAEAQAA